MENSIKGIIVVAWTTAQCPQGRWPWEAEQGHARRVQEGPISSNCLGRSWDLNGISLNAKHWSALYTLHPFFYVCGDGGTSFPFSGLIGNLLIFNGLSRVPPSVVIQPWPIDRWSGYSGRWWENPFTYQLWECNNLATWIKIFFFSNFIFSLRTR